MAAATVRPPDAPAARDSSVYGPPTAGIDAGSAKSWLAPRCAEMKFKRVAKAAITTTPVRRPRMRLRPAPAASEAIAAASTRAL